MNNQAIILSRFGGADTTELSATEMPHAAPGLVVVRVRAAGINGLDWRPAPALPSATASSASRLPATALMPIMSRCPKPF